MRAPHINLEQMQWTIYAPPSETNVLQLSSFHLQPRTRAWLLGDNFDGCYYDVIYGPIFRVLYESERARAMLKRNSPDLADCFALAKSLERTYIKFAASISVDKRLPVYQTSERLVPITGV
jgi:hypothetical protein